MYRPIQRNEPLLQGDLRQDEPNVNPPQDGARAMLIQPNIPVPSKMVCQGDVSSNWEYFRQQYEDYETATAINERSDNIRAATLRSVMGKDCIQILQNLSLSTAERNNVNTCLDRLEDRFKPQKNVIYERFNFHTTSQEPDESFDAFLNKLRKRAATCNFGAMTDEMIRDRIVIGVKNTSLTERMLRMKDLNLDKAIEVSKASEIASKQVQSLGKPESNAIEEMNVIKSTDKQRGRPPAASKKREKNRELPSKSASYPRKSQSNKQWKCLRCGQLKKHMNYDECQTVGQTCSKCKKLNHFASVCMTSRERPIKTLEEESTSESESEESLFKVQTVSSLKGRGKQVHAEINFCIQEQGNKTYKTSLTCQLDTGATCNVISHRDLAVLTQMGEPPK